MAIEGAMITWGDAPTIFVSSLRPVAMRLPHDGVDGGTPTPRMLNPPSSTMTTAMPRRAIENIAGRTFGNTSRLMIRRFRAPMLRDASTNSRCAHERVLARVIRPMIGTDTMPIETISQNSRLPTLTAGSLANTATSASASTS